MSLNLHGNALLTSHGLLPFSQLVELDLSANSIKNLADFENLQLLKRLNLSSNLIESISTELHHLTSLEELNLSYNLLVDIRGLEKCPGPISTLNLHGNSIERVIPTLSQMAVRHLTLEDQTSPTLLFRRLENLETLDGATESGEKFDDRQCEPILPPRPKFNPWAESEPKVPDIREHVLKATENLSTKYETAQLETQSKIEKLEETIRQLTAKQAPTKPPKTSKTIPKKKTIAEIKLFDEVKAMQRVINQKDRENEKLLDQVNRLQLEYRTKFDEQKSLLYQKSAQLETALEAASKFKFHLKQEKEKNESIEQTVGRLNKQLSVSRQETSKTVDRLKTLELEHQKTHSENATLKTKLFEKEKSLSEVTEAKSAQGAKICELEKRLENFIDPESKEFATLLRQKTTQVELAFNQYKAKYETKYGALESEFRSALLTESQIQSKLRSDLDSSREKLVEHQIERQKLLSEISKSQDQLKSEQKRIKDCMLNNQALEDKIDRLVETVRKTKELADDRYRYDVIYNIILTCFSVMSKKPRQSFGISWLNGQN